MNRKQKKVPPPVHVKIIYSYLSLNSCSYLNLNSHSGWNSYLNLNLYWRLNEDKSLAGDMNRQHKVHLGLHTPHNQSMSQLLQQLEPAKGAAKGAVQKQLLLHNLSS